MPMFDYQCKACSHKKEHFDSPGKDYDRDCPECGSDEYYKCMGSFFLNVEYSTTEELMEKKIDPSIQEVYKKIGQETLDQDTKTLDNIYGGEKVADTYYGGDD